MYGAFARFAKPCGPALIAGPLFFSACAADPAHDPACVPDLSAYDVAPFREPERPSQPLTPIDGTGWQASLDVTLPPEANSGTTSLTYWLTGDEELSFRLAVHKGGLDPDATFAFTGVVFLDGVQQTVEIGGSPVRQLPATVSSAAPSTTLDVRVPAAQVPDGAHLWSIYFVDTTNIERYLQFGFTSLKNSTAFGDLYPPVAGTPFARVDTVNGHSQFEDARSGTCLCQHDNSVAPGVDGTLPIVIRHQFNNTGFQTCSNLTYDELLVALVDGEQVPLGELGLHPRFSLTYSEGVMTQATLRGLPVGGGPHQLVVLSLAGYGHYNEAPLGELSLWDAPQGVAAFAQW